MDEQQLAILELQQYLRNISKADPSFISIVPDGIYGDKTAQAVKLVQNKHNLEPTGKVDLETWKALIRENEKALFQLTEPIQVVSITNSDLPLKVGDVSPFVHMLKLMLTDVSNKHTNFNSLDVTDFFDIPTENEVKRWQQVIFVPQTGIVDKETWNMLAEHYLLKEEFL